MSEENKEVIVKNERERDFELIQREASALSKSELIPQNFRGKVADCIIAIEMSRRIGAAPLAVLQQIYIVHGKPSWSSQFIIAVVNTCGRFKPLKFHYEGEGQSASCIAYTHYADEPEKSIKGPKVTMAMADAEGWSKKNGSKWKTMPELMLSYRAATFFGRLYCPDLLMGMQTTEELYDIQVSNEPEIQKPTFGITKDSAINAFKCSKSTEELTGKWGMVDDQAPDLLKDDELVKVYNDKHAELK